MNTVTSLSDTDRFRLACAQAAADDAAFARFRRIEEIFEVVEPPVSDPDSVAKGYYDSAPDAREYAEHVRSIAPYRPLLEAFEGNDRVGAPLVQDFEGLGRFNVYTLRYIKICWDLERLFGNLDGRHILEIGGGYGGQGAIVARRFAVASYDILDLPEAGALQARYLSAVGVAGTRSVSDLSSLRAGYDLVVSNYAFSELSDPVRAAYRAGVLPRCARGFMLWNRIYHDLHVFQKDWDTAVASFRDEMQDLFARVANPRVVEDLLTNDDRVRGNLMIAWG